MIITQNGITYHCYTEEENKEIKEALQIARFVKSNKSSFNQEVNI